VGLQASIENVEQAINPGLYYGFLMRDPFRPRELSCGKHANSGIVLEYFVISGTLEMVGTSTNSAGGTVTSKLHVKIG
jgi:hypothetical protein